MGDPWDKYLKFEEDGTLRIMDGDLYVRLEDAFMTVKKGRRFSIWWKEPLSPCRALRLSETPSEA